MITCGQEWRTPEQRPSEAIVTTRAEFDGKRENKDPNSEG